MARWEYFVATLTRGLLGKWSWDDTDLRGVDLTAGLDAYGFNGWELVSSVVMESDDRGTAKSVEYTFKRPVA